MPLIIDITTIKGFQTLHRFIVKKLSEGNGMTTNDVNTLAVMAHEVSMSLVANSKGEVHDRPTKQS